MAAAAGDAEAGAAEPGAMPLHLGADHLAAAVRRAHESDAALTADVFFENLAGKASATLALLRVLHDNDTHCRYEQGIPHLHIAHCTFGRVTGKGHGAFQEQKPSPDLQVRGCLFLGEKPGQAKDATVNASRLERVENGKKVLASAKLVATSRSNQKK